MLERYPALEVPMNGNGYPEFYLATATAIPLLLIAYLYSVGPENTLRKYADKLNKDLLDNLVIGVGLAVMPLALVAAIGGEAASLQALYGRSPSGYQAWWSQFGVIGIAAAAFVNMVIAFLVRQFSPAKPPSADSA